MDYKIVPLTNIDTERVVSFLIKYFFRDEPLNICVNLLTSPSDKCIELEEYCRSSIPDGVSLMAVTGDNEILGVAINGVLKRSIPESDDVDECKNQKFKKILNLIAYVGRNSNVFTQFPDVNECIDIRVISVSDACRCRGIARDVVSSVKNIAVERGIPLIKIDCTSHFSHMTVAKLGYQIIYELKYSDHVDGNGIPVFIPEEPHQSVKTCVLRIA